MRGETLAEDLKPPVNPKEVESAVDSLIDLIGEEAQRIRRKLETRALHTRRSGPVRTVGSNRPDVVERVRSDIRAALEKDVVIAPEAHGEQEIDPSEFEREIMKRALVKLKLSDLKEEARDRDLDWRGTEEQVADRVARALGFNEQLVAELVLKYDEDRAPERGITDRLYALAQPLDDLESVGTMVGHLVRHYVRVGVARWFVFRAVESLPGSVRVSGLFRSFRAEASEVEDDYRISPIEMSARATVTLSRGREEVRIRARGASEASAALAAIEKVASIKKAPVLPFRFEAPAEVMSWDRRTLFLLDLVANALRDGPFNVENLTTAQFEADQSEIESDRVTPRIRSVKLEGDWVADSPQACDLLVRRRPLVGVSLLLRFKPNRDEAFYVPVRVAVARDHITVTTGLGKETRTNAGEAHREIMRRIESGLTRLYNEQATVALTRSIALRAAEQGNVDVNLFSAPTREERSEESQASR